jgi:murein DD-endopeptidase MepM/ murein hydrolase activator NlpD
MTLLHWVPIFSTILWLSLLSVGTKANSANILRQPPDPERRVSTEESFTPLTEGVNLSAQEQQPVEDYTGFPGYPLPSVAPIALNYGWHKDPDTEQAKFHSGIDLLADSGTPVLSVDAGVVAFAGERGNYGVLVVVNHQGGRQTRYAHLASVSVSTGQNVKLGDRLGTVGSTGRPDIDKPHLHFELRYNSSEGWVAQDPEPNLKARPTLQR